MEEDFEHVQKILRVDGKINNRLFTESNETVVYIKNKYPEQYSKYGFSGVVNVILHNESNFNCVCGEELDKIHYDLKFKCLKCRYVARQNTYEKNNLEKYGVKYTAQLCEVKNKIKETNINRYGVDNVFQSNLVKDKVKSTTREKYGVDNVSQLDSVKTKTKKTNVEKYGSTHFMTSEIYRETIFSGISKEFVDNPKKIYDEYMEDKSIFILKEFSEYLGVDSMTCSKYLYRNGIYPVYSNGTSLEEKELVDFVSSHVSNVLINSRSVIPPYEIDIYLPNNNICIEYNGVYWHSLKERGYHLNKTNMCEKNGFSLLHVNSNEWIEKKELVKSIILSKLGIFQEKIYARKTKIEILSKDQERLFLNENHLQGYIKSDICYGLFHGEELVSIMSFGKPRFDKNVDFELLRYAIKKNTLVVGGASKLFRKFEIGNIGKSVVSYADRRYSQGKIYETIGMSFVGNTSPNFKYVKNGVIVGGRMSFQKHKIKHLMENYDDLISTKKNLENNGYTILYDCGNKKFVKNMA